MPKNKSTWDRVWELMRAYSEISRDARTGGMTSTIKDIDNLDISDEEKVARKQNFALKHIGANLAGISLGTSVAQWGLVPGIVTEAGAAGGARGGYKLGEKADEKYGTKWITPTLGLIGGIGGGAGAYKGLVKAGTKGLLKGNGVMYDKNFVNDVVATSLNKASKVPHKPTGLVKQHGNEIGEDVRQITFTPKQPSRGTTSYKFYERPSKLSELELKGVPKGERPSYYKNLGKSKISPEESAGIPKGERNNGRYNGIYFFRTLGRVPSIDPRGYVQIGNAHRPIVNTTTDQLVHTHGLYPSWNRHVIVINPEGLRGSTLASLDPSDTMIINDKSLKIKPKHVIFISGDADAIAEATKRGFDVISTPKLKRWIDNDHKFYHNEIRRIIDTYFSRPTLDVYKKMSRNTGLPLSVEEFTGRNFPKNIPKDVNWTKQDFKHVVYDPASIVEHQTWTNHGLNVDFEHRSSIPFQTYMRDGRWVSTSSGHTYKSKPRLVQRGQSGPYHSEDDKMLYQRLKAMIKNLKSKYKPLKKQGGKLKKYSPGGHIEEEKNTVPTREEYIAQRLEEARLKALEKSRTRVMPRSPIILNEESEEEHNAKRKLFTENIGRLQDALKELETSKTLGMFVDKQIEHTKKKIATYQDWLSMPYEKYKKGASCIYTATDNYGKEYLVSGNKTFASNPQKYGFKKIEKTNMQPGDLVQDVSLGYPSHAMIYNGKNESELDTFNYSRGGNSEGDIVKGGTYKQNVPLDVFRFVGTAKDSAQYINDYNRIYGK